MNRMKPIEGNDEGIPTLKGEGERDEREGTPAIKSTPPQTLLEREIDVCCRGFLQPITRITFMKLASDPHRTVDPPGP